MSLLGRRFNKGLTHTQKKVFHLLILLIIVGDLALVGAALADWSFALLALIIELEG